MAVLVALTRMQHMLYSAVRTAPPPAHAPRAIVARKRINVVVITRPRAAKQIAGSVDEQVLDIPFLAATQIKLVIQKVGVAIRVTANAAVLRGIGVAVVVIVCGAR